MASTQNAPAYTQPEKLDRIDADPDANNPTAFLERLRDGQGLTERGYLANVEPLPFYTPKPLGHTRFVCISDTHTKHDGLNLPEGDVLLHCGDFTKVGKFKEVDSFNDWLGRQPFQHKIAIAGNHDLTFDPTIMTKIENGEATHLHKWTKQLRKIKRSEWEVVTGRLTNCTYLEDGEVTINGIRIWGSPWQPENKSWAFNLPRGEQILERWNKTPSNGIDILMTHGPPAGHGDKDKRGMSVGCVDLLNSVQLRIQPKYHVFGHIHEASGITTDRFTTYINCSVVDNDYNLVSQPVIFDFPNKLG